MITRSIANCTENLEPYMQFFWLCCRIGKIGQAKENNEKLAHLTTCDLLVFFYVKTATSINDTHIIT